MLSSRVLGPCLQSSSSRARLSELKLHHVETGANASLVRVKTSGWSLDGLGGPIQCSSVLSVK